jgi:hypothetical protein
MGVILVPLYLLLFIAQAAAYFQGMEIWLGVGWLGALAIAFLVGTFVPMGAVALSGIAFYGAWKGWHWDWWQAALLTWPFGILSIVMMLFSGAAGLVGLLRARATA